MPFEHFWLSDAKGLRATVVAWRLPAITWIIVNLSIGPSILHFRLIAKINIREKAFEIVFCKTVPILFGPQYINHYPRRITCHSMQVYQWNWFIKPINFTKDMVVINYIAFLHINFRAPIDCILRKFKISDMSVCVDIWWHLKPCIFIKYIHLMII